MQSNSTKRCQVTAYSGRATSHRQRRNPDQRRKLAGAECVGDAEDRLGVGEPQHDTGSGGGYHPCGRDVAGPAPGDEYLSHVDHRQCCHCPGRCQCGAISYTLNNEPLFGYACHCYNCQKRTGSAFSMGLVITLDSLELEGELVELNEELLSDPSGINVDKYGAGWLYALGAGEEGLLSPAEYLNHLTVVWEVTQRTIKGQLNE